MYGAVTSISSAGDPTYTANIKQSHQKICKNKQILAPIALQWSETHPGDTQTKWFIVLKALHFSLSSTDDDLFDGLCVDAVFVRSTLCVF